METILAETMFLETTINTISNGLGETISNLLGKTISNLFNLMEAF